MNKNFESVKVGDIIICWDEYSHDYEEHKFEVTSIDYDEEEGKKCYGIDLDYGEDEGIGVVTESNFIRIF